MKMSLVTTAVMRVEEVVRMSLQVKDGQHKSSQWSYQCYIRPGKPDTRPRAKRSFPTRQDYNE